MNPAAKPYLLVSDIHAHKWSQFATTNADGVNSRLQIILDELVRAAAELKLRGGNYMLIAGDIFHVRGSIDPEVFNPVHRTFQEILDMGIDIYAIPGNHDLAGKDTTKLGNAFQSLETLAAHCSDGTLREFFVVTEPDGVSMDGPVIMVPWQATKAKLRETVEKIKREYVGYENTDLILHVGIDGMLDGVPASGLSAAEVASWGFKRVFAGDYHNYRVAEGGKVISIGATTHQTWSDIGSGAGFLLVYPDYHEYCASHAPSFIEITGEHDPEDIPLMVDGNYVRVRGMKLTDKELIEFRDELTGMGARGVTFQVTREVVAARGSSALAKATTLDEAVDKYIDGMKDPVWEVSDPDVLAKIKTVATEVLSTVRSVAA